MSSEQPPALRPWVSAVPKEPGHYELLLETGLLFVVELFRDRHGLVIWGSPYDGRFVSDYGVEGLERALWRRVDFLQAWVP